MNKINRVLVVNRGEIACRIIKTLHEMDIEAVSVFSDVDRNSTHTRMSQMRVHLPGVLPKDTYLNAAKMVQIAKDTGCDAVHPGYGFLSENSDFASLVQENGIKFIGPSPASMEKLGNKIQARKLMQAHGVPIVPGCEGELASLSELENTVAEIGFPVIIKAAAGGGGRGMRIVREVGEIKAAYESCRREAESYFGNSAVFCERYIENPRHIEYQVLFDEHGHGVHLFERDCSIQRRHQKLFEEAPSQYLNSEQRAHLGRIAVQAAQAASYSGVGTIEFICESPDKAYFMEMNTRIQVEHPVTEMITGVDLIQMQVRVAQGEALPFRQEDIQLHGWAVEARINAEDASQGFIPQAGVIDKVFIPAGPFTRVDTHIYQGYKVPDSYDSMIAKVITWGQDRQAAMKRLRRALAEMHVGGIKTTTPFHQALIAHPKFAAADFSTHFIAQNEEELTSGLLADQPDADECQLGALLAQKHRFPLAHPSPQSKQESIWGRKARLDSVQGENLV